MGDPETIKDPNILEQVLVNLESHPGLSCRQVRGRVRGPAARQRSSAAAGPIAALPYPPMSKQPTVGGVSVENCAAVVDNPCLHTCMGVGNLQVGGEC